LHQRADLVDRAGDGAGRDRAIGAHHRGVPLPFIDEDFASPKRARLDDRGERNARLGPFVRNRRNGAIDPIDPAVGRIPDAAVLGIRTAIKF
jgi:hypothetical protein